MLQLGLLFHNRLLLIAQDLHQELQGDYFKNFLDEHKDNLKSEYFIPLMVNKLITDGTATVEVLDTTSKWFGVTYAEDRQGVVDKIAELVKAGEYPAKLF